VGSFARRIARTNEREEERRVLGTLRGLKVQPAPAREFPMATAPWRARVAFAWAVLFLPFYILTLACVWGVDQVQRIANKIDGREGRDYWGRK